MPLTPNGKVDKNALPFPDTVAAASSVDSNQLLTELELQIIGIWTEILGLQRSTASQNSSTASAPFLKTDNFFEIGGHSILATRLIFSLRKHFKISIPLTLIFTHSTVQSMAAEVEKLVGYGVVSEGQSSETFDSVTLRLPSGNTLDADALDMDRLDLMEEVRVEEWMRPTIPVSLSRSPFAPKSIFLTGATGFLGAFLLHQLLNAFPDALVFCLIRASDRVAARGRLNSNMLVHALWRESDDHTSPTSQQYRTRVIVGDLSQPWFNLTSGVDLSDFLGHFSGSNFTDKNFTDKNFTDGNFTDKNLNPPDHSSSNSFLFKNAPKPFIQLAASIDCVVHNGALVHWVFPYANLKRANVDGTLECLKLCLLSRTAVTPLYFISSTSVFDSSNYASKGVVLESDSLESGRRSLKTGYAQSKWVAEKLLMAARDAHHLPIIILRPGYIIGHSTTGVTNADDFLWRMCKGCVELGLAPNIVNLLNACPVDFVASIVTSVVSRGAEALERGGCFNIVLPQHFTFTDMFRVVELVRPIKFVPYITWRDALTEHVSKADDSALYPLLHFVLDDLPTSTRGPNLDYKNMQWISESDGVSCAEMKSTGGCVWMCLKYLEAQGFFSGQSKNLLTRRKE